MIDMGQNARCRESDSVATLRQSYGLAIPGPNPVAGGGPEHYVTLRLATQTAPFQAPIL